MDFLYTLIFLYFLRIVKAVQPCMEEIPIKKNKITSIIKMRQKQFLEELISIFVLI